MARFRRSQQHGMDSIPSQRTTPQKQNKTKKLLTFNHNKKTLRHRKKTIRKSRQMKNLEKNL